MFRTLPRQVYQVWIPLIGILAAIGCYFSFVFIHAVNIPFADDILDVVQFVVKFVESSSPAEIAVPSEH